MKIAGLDSHLVRLHEYCVEGLSAYMVIELCEQTLYSYLDKAPEITSSLSLGFVL